MKRNPSLAATAALTTLLQGPLLADASASRTWVPTVRAGDRFQTAPVTLGRTFTLPPDSKVREKGQYSLEFEGMGARDRIRLTLRRLDKPGGDSGGPAQILIALRTWALKCSVNKGIQPSDNPRGGVEPADNPRGGIQPEDRPRSFGELGFRPNAPASVRMLSQGMSLEIEGPPQPGVGQCVMKVTLEAGK